MTTLLGLVKVRPAGRGVPLRWLSPSSFALSTREVVGEARARATLPQHSVSGRQSSSLAAGAEQTSADVAHSNGTEGVFNARLPHLPDSGMLDCPTGLSICVH